MPHAFILVLTVLCICCTGGNAMALGNNGWYSTPRHPNAGKFVPWECAFERDHVPPLPPEADKLFMEARSLQKSTPRASEEELVRIFNLYKKAAEMGHWRATFNLANCYLEGKGVAHSVTTADTIYEDMMAKGIPAGYYGKAFLTKRGLAVPQSDEKARHLLQQAADLGSPQAQYDLGEIYFYEHRSKQSLVYHVCATRQGHGPSAYQIGLFLSDLGDVENYPMAMEYYWRGVTFGDSSSAFQISETFNPESQEYGEQLTFGYAGDQELYHTVEGYYDKILDDSAARFPNFFTEHPIPAHPSISWEKSRKMPSELKDAYGGRWPDEIFPELAPGYVPPKW